MRRAFRAPPRARVQAVALTLLAHSAVFVLIWVERRAPQDMHAPELQYVSIWPEVRTETPSVPTANAERLTEQNMPARPSLRTDHPPQNLLAPAVMEQSQQLASAAPGSISVQSPVDWNAAAASAAARIARDAGKQQSLSAAPQVLRKPCKPRVFDDGAKRLMAERLPERADPDPVGPDPKANCIVVGGYPKCVQKLTAKVGRRGSTGDLFKDRLAGKQPASSVPSPDVCD